MSFVEILILIHMARFTLDFNITNSSYNIMTINMDIGTVSYDTDKAFFISSYK